MIAGIRRLLVFGAGGHGREVAWLAREALPGVALEYVVEKIYRQVGSIDGVPVRTSDEIEGGPDTGYICAVGDGALRRRAAQEFTGRGLRAVTLVHPRAEIAPGASIDEGAVVCAGAVVSEGARIGAHVIVNIGCTVSHDVTIGAFATLSPGVHIAGNVTIGDGAMLGIGACVVNGSPARPLVIGTGAVVGAGAAVIRDVGVGAVVVGVPARPIGRRES
jgi:sugar O-acyltransferase (sialic acid O-acetyltransferase NeuD family)